MKSECRFIRARQPEQKEQRRTQILQAAATLLEDQGFENVSLNGIARQAKVAKSNIYRYFESREDIYLQLLKDDWRNWLDDIELSLSPLENSDDIDQVTALIASKIAAAPRMCQLISVLASVLEHNLSEELLYNFKLESVAMGMRLVGMLQSALPGIKQENLLPAVQSMIALIAGLWPLGNPNERVSKIMEKPELSAFRLEFDIAIAQSLRLLARGAY
ncbi:MAG: TetR family transcriptional regulator [Ketobacteraceae bacterium]|nr:TetR family transcriptional regulator [Ketobacteraceae bacterium]